MNISKKNTRQTEKSTLTLETIQTLSKLNLKKEKCKNNTNIHTKSNQPANAPSN